MKIMFKVPLKRWKHLRRRIRSTEFAAKAPSLIGKEVFGGYKWATFRSPYIGDIVKVCSMLPEGSECWQVEYTDEGCVAISMVCLMASSKV